MPVLIRFAKAAQGWGELHSPGSAQTAWESLIPEWLAALQNGHFTLINRAGIAFPLFFPFYPGDPDSDKKGECNSPLRNAARLPLQTGLKALFP